MEQENRRFIAYGEDYEIIKDQYKDLDLKYDEEGNYWYI